MGLDITGIGAVSDLVGSVVSRIWPDKSEIEKQQLAAAVLMIQSQLDINKVEAAHPSIFVSGWRPAIGWVCGAGCAWNWVLLPVAKVLLPMAGYVVAVSPADLSEMMPLLFGLLGLGSLRTVEKLNGKARL